MTIMSKTSEDVYKQTIRREMTITHDEFFRLLSRALKNYQYNKSDADIFVSLTAGQLKISLEPQTQRTIGSLVLPVTRINFVFNNCPENLCNKFFQDFDLAYQKGGG